LSVLLQAYYDIGYLFTVNEGVFYPPPRVKSAVIRLRRNTTLKLDCDEKMFFLTVKTAFNQRRKTLRNALKAITAPSAASSPGIKEMLGKRAEQMSVEDFVMLSRVMQV
jgi:16S rRNA (adenine1518-N6/adenine1519-N6)-dimethyltransferase